MNRFLTFLAFLAIATLPGTLAGGFVYGLIHLALPQDNLSPNGQALLTMAMVSLGSFTLFLSILGLYSLEKRYTADHITA